MLLASTRLYASLPVVGRHLEPFAGLAAMALYGGHYAPAAVRAAVSRRFGSADVTTAADAVEPLVERGPVHEARQFRAALKSSSRNGVVYCEIPRAGHAFDLVDTSHARRCAVEVSNFLDGVRARLAESRSATAV
jgi:hypothetical protein